MNPPSLAFVRLRETCPRASHDGSAAPDSKLLITVILILLLAISVICMTLEAQ